MYLGNGGCTVSLVNREQWDIRYRDKELVWSAGPNQFVVSEIDSMAPGRALDVACGEGRNAIWLREKGWQVSATDFSPIAIEKAQARGLELGLDIDFQVADATKELKGSYDLILFAYLHLPQEQLAKALQLAQEALAVGSSILIIGHDLRNIEEGVGGPQDPDILQSPEGLKALLTELDIKRAETVVRLVEKNGETHKALDVIVRATKSS